jgi:hypothetical protein
VTTEPTPKLSIVPDVQPQVRPHVARLLAATDMGSVMNAASRTDWKRIDGTPLTAEERDLVANANRQDLLAGREILDREAEKARADGADMNRVAELAEPYYQQFGEGSTMGDVVKVMPEPERTELIELLERLTPMPTSETICDLIEAAGQELADRIAIDRTPGYESTLADRMIDGTDDAGRDTLFEFLIFNKLDRLIEVDGLLPDLDESHNATTEMGAVLIREIKRQDFVGEALHELVESAIVRECNYIRTRGKAERIVDDKIATGELIRVPSGGLIEPGDPNYTGPTLVPVV